MNTLFRKIEQKDKKEECAGWKHLLVNTNLIENSRDSGKIVSTYWDGKVVLWATSGCTWNAYENVILDNVHNNSCLAKLVKEKIIECNQHVNNCDFFWGWDIRFKYKESYFVYYNNNTICLMDDNWNGKKLKDSTKPDIPENNFYFPVSENESNVSFLNKLECLIAQAYPDADKHVCEGCHNKICVITTE